MEPQELEQGRQYLYIDDVPENITYMHRTINYYVFLRRNDEEIKLPYTTVKEKVRQ